jgi:hypothetical protein
LWDVNEVTVWSTISFDHVLVIVGRFLNTNECFALLNVYAPCDVSRQQVLWDNISLKLNSYWARIFVIVVTLMRSVVWWSAIVWDCCVGSQGSQISTSLLMVIYLLIFRSMVAALLGIMGMGDL